MMAICKSRVRALALGTSALLTLALAAAPTAAQYYPAPRAYPPAPPPPPPPQAMLAPHHADAVVRSLGLTPLGRAQPQGPMFVVPAMGQEGTQVQVTLDRRTGRVVEIMRIGTGAPRMATLPPTPPRDPYYADDDDDEFVEFDNDEVFPPLVRGAPPARTYPGAGRGPAVITREGIEADDLPPLGSGPRVVERDPDITGSVSRNPYIGSVPPTGRPAPVDPLLGVPKEFRGQQPRGTAPSPPQRTAARPPESSPRTAPLPRPRPADAPTFARNAKAGQPAAEPGAEESSVAPEAKEEAEKFPPVQAFE
jgi:hypothetical protein